MHKGFDLYSAALPVGMTAFFLNATLYKTLGVALPAGADAAQLQVASRLTVDTLQARVSKDSSRYGYSVFLMYVGVFGLFILGYYNLIGASFNGVTFGIIFCMLSTCNSGSHPGNVWPIMLGYVVASTVCGLVSPLVGGTFTFAVNAQAICVGLCYANGLSPIADKYGWRYGFLAAVMHYLLVTSVPTLHGGYCLYNGGFTAALICIILVPSLERFSRDKFERKALKTK